MRNTLCRPTIVFIHSHDHDTKSQMKTEQFLSILVSASFAATYALGIRRFELVSHCSKTEQKPNSAKLSANEVSMAHSRNVKCFVSIHAHAPSHTDTSCLLFRIDANVKVENQLMKIHFEIRSKTNKFHCGRKFTIPNVTEWPSATAQCLRKWSKHRFN